MPEFPAVTGWRLQVQVPDGIFTLAVEADDATAREEHAAFVERCLPLLMSAGDSADAPRLRHELASQLAALRQSVAATGLGFLGTVAGEHDDRYALVLLAVAATPQQFPDTIDSASLLAAMLRHQYPHGAIEEFRVAAGTGVGIRRCERLHLPLAADGSEPLTIDAGISQALVPFPDAGLLGTVTGFSFYAEDVDLATVFTATIAFSMKVILTGR